MRPFEESNRLTTPGITPRPLTVTVNAKSTTVPFIQASRRRSGVGEREELTRAVLLAGVEEQLETEADA